LHLGVAQQAPSAVPADAISKELRELDARIQEANWTIELIE
jgi:hypothetical protein